MLMGAHVVRANAKPLALLLPLLFVLLFAPMSNSLSESDTLLNFKASLINNDVLSNWNALKPPCEGDHGNWIGVLCMEGSVYGLQLKHMGLSGRIDIDSLVSLPYFETLNLMDNNFGGPLPDVKKLGKLEVLYLSNNMFSGDLEDDAFQGMGLLRLVYLGNNQFTGEIPSSLTTLERLEELRLEGNQLQGQIPEFRRDGLKVNVASNELFGPIPASLSNLSPRSFSGNKGLCGTPLLPCNDTTPTTSSPGATRKKSTSNGDHKIIFTILIIVVLILALILLAPIIFSWRKSRPESDKPTLCTNESIRMIPSFNGKDERGEAHDARRGDRHMKLSFLRDDIERFDLQDLLRASAEVLGSGTFGSSYKAVVKGGPPLVVKRYKHMNNVGREEFHEHMTMIGRLNHQNLLPVVGYYYRKDEKLLVTEFVENGSLATHLHGNHSPEEGGLNWQTRVKIVKGIGRGLAHLYRELPIMLPCGHLKSSNVLLNDYFEPLLTDYALRPLISPEHAHLLMIAYRSPEYTLHGRASNKSDVWSFGILILEILTGRFPENYVTQGYDRQSDLATWVNNMVKEKRTSEVFDKEMVGTKDSKGEMISLLKIGLSCCEEDVERRLDIREVVDKIDNIHEGEDYGDEEYFGNGFSGIKGAVDDVTSAFG